MSPSSITRSPKPSRSPGLPVPGRPQLCHLPPLASILFPLAVPTALSAHCRARARSTGLDPDSLHLRMPQFTSCLGKPSSRPESPPSDLGGPRITPGVCEGAGNVSSTAQVTEVSRRKRGARGRVRTFGMMGNVRKFPFACSLGTEQGGHIWAQHRADIATLSMRLDRSHLGHKDTADPVLDTPQRSLGSNTYDPFKPGQEKGLRDIIGENTRN